MPIRQPDQLKEQELFDKSCYLQFGKFYWIIGEKGEREKVIQIRGLGPNNPRRLIYGRVFNVCRGGFSSFEEGLSDKLLSVRLGDQLSKRELRVFRKLWERKIREFFSSKIGLSVPIY